MSAATRLPPGYQLAPAADWNAVGLNPPGNLSQWRIRSGYLVPPAGASPSPGLVVLKRGNRLIERWVVPKVPQPTHQAKVVHSAATHAQHRATSGQLHRAPAHHQVRVVHHQPVHHSEAVVSQSQQAYRTSHPAPAVRPAVSADQVATQGQPGVHAATPSPQGALTHTGSPGASVNTNQTASRQPTGKGNSLPAAPHAIEIHSAASQAKAKAHAAAAPSLQGQGSRQAASQAPAKTHTVASTPAHGASSVMGFLSIPKHQIYAGGVILMIALLVALMVRKARADRDDLEDTLYYDDPSAQAKYRGRGRTKAKRPAPALQASASAKPPPNLPEDEVDIEEADEDMQLSPEFARRVQDNPEILTAAECGMFEELDEDGEGPIDITPASVSFNLLEKAS